MTLSIIIVSFNTERITKNCIESIFKNPPDFSYEIIVVDNNSQDGSLQMLSNYKKKIKLIKNDSNLGFSKANNQGIRASKGEYKLLLNSDTLVKEGSLQRLVEIARKFDDAGVLGPRLLNADGTTQPSCFNLPNLPRAISTYIFKSSVLNKFSPEGQSTVQVESVVGAAFLITQKAIKKVGLLSEKFFFYYEDLDYCKRVIKSGLKVYFSPQSEIIHLHGASGKGKTSPYLIESSKIYHGPIEHHAINLVIKMGRVIDKLVK